MGLVLFFGVILFTVLFGIAAAFFRNVVVFDSLLLSIVSGIFCHQQFGIHPAFCLVIGIIVFFIMNFIQFSKIGFWVVGTAFSILWARIFGQLAYEEFHNDPIWGWVIGILSFIIVMFLHVYARSKMNLSVSEYV